MLRNEISIEYVPVEQIVPYENNAKEHPEDQVRQIVESIEEFGMNDPIAVWTDGDGNSVIVEGHGRLLAAKELKMDVVPVIRLDSLTDEQRRAYALVHNKLTMNSDFDMELLELELSNIEQFDMSDFGFEFELDDDFDESDLDDDDEKTSVVVSINCGDVSNYEKIRDRLDELVGEIDGSMAVKMQ